MYDETCGILKPIISMSHRRSLIREDIAEWLEAHIGSWELDVVRSAVLVELFSHHFKVYELCFAMVQLLVAFHDAVPGCDIQTYIYYIAYEKMGMDRIPPTRLLSDAIFKKLMTDLLEPARRIRTNKRLDIQMFIILTVSYGRWRRQHSTLFSPSVFGTWVNGIASTRPETIRDTITFLRGRGFNRRVGDLKYHHETTILLRWRQQRKRKRETTDTIGDCGICFDVTVNVKKLRCGHDFCAECLGSWAKPTCPTCRARS